MEQHHEAIMNLIRQLATHQFEYDENKARLEDLLDQQASRAAAAAAPSAPAAAAPSAPASAAVSSAPAAAVPAAAASADNDSNDSDVIDPTNITIYDNTRVTITVHYNYNWVSPNHLCLHL